MVPESERPDADEASEILSACAALPLTERSAFLDTRCAGRPTLRSEVEELLSFLHDPEFEEGDERDDETARARRRVGSEIGGCRLVELLAMGGMGAVYRAEQESPRREVALKLLRPDGLGTDAWRRLKREALVLGRLDHPAIARVFTAGIHRDAHGATPYLIMELVEGGRPMSDWWRERDLPLARRIALFATVCEAIHHGHIKGVLHRDVKPGNLLVDREDRPKVIDFGIARMLEPGSDDENAPATEGRVIGTIAYMAPERLDGSQAIDVRSDVYGLGIVLYELLTGRLPFGRPNGSIAATATAIALGQVAPPSSVDRRCRGDLDAIVAKAMSADPADRYDSASALAADLRSHLENGPIQARGVGRVTRVRKFLVRNRIATTAMVAVFVALAIGLSLSLRATAAAERSLYLSLLAQGSLMASRNDMGSALRVLKSLGPDRQGEWPVRAIARFTNPTIDSARFEDWRLFRGRLSPNRDRLLAYGCGERPELIVMKSSPAGIQGRIPLPSPGMGADWGIRLPDGTETAIAGLADGRVIEVVATDGSIIREITRIHPSPSDGPTGPISDVALEPGGRRLAVAHSSDSIRLVDLQDGSAVDHHGFSDPASPDWIFVEWHPKGGTLAAAASGGTYVIGEPDGSVRRISSRPSRQSTFSPDGLRLATALTRGGSEIIEVSSGTSTMILPSAWPAWGVDWSPDGQFVSVVGESHWMVVFDSAGRIRRWQRSNISDARTVRWISETEFIILPVGQVYSLTTPQGILPPTRLGHEHSDRVELRARFDDDGRYLICTGPEGQIDRVDPLLETRVELARMPVLAASTDVSPDGSMVAVVDGIRNGPLWLFDTRDGLTRRIDGDFRGPVMFSPDARRIVIMGRELEAIVIHLESGRIEHRHERTSAKTTVGLAWLDPESLILADSRHATMLAMEGDKRWVSRPMPIESVRERWPIGSGHWYSGFGRDADSISGMSFLRASGFRETVLAMGIAQCMAPHPTRPLTAVGMTSGLVVIYDESLEAVVSSHEVMSRRVTSIAWTPDGEMVAAIDAGGGIRIIDSMPLVERWPEIDRTRRLISATAADPSPSAPPSGDAEPD